ncbi:apolipoprotein N-acyltransferase [Pseudonocardia sp. EC080625-04]|uniref:apolipoprotein N-acyltransferase n=1 Tax=Pseudonocardia sp. EC080625-04 TaxID=1096868 RepID=UPI001EE71D18|nr:apolipoprotein N-acyltransferase [Pseudonocardia sp. EC080625-04]
MASVRVPPAPGPVAGDPAVSRRQRWLASGAVAAVAAAAGVLLYLSFPPRDGLWWLAVPAFAVLGLLLRDARPGRGFLAGFAFGLGFLVPLLVWVGALVQTPPWLALSAFESLFLGLTGAVMALVSRVPGRLGVLWPVWAAAVWVGGELLRGSVPFGGFPWGRVGFSQPESPLLPVAAIGGVPLLSFATVLAGLALTELLRRAVAGRVAGLPAPRPAGDGRAGALRAVAVPVVLLLLVGVAGPLAALVPPSPGPPARTVTVAAIQGNVPRLGLDFNAQRRAVLDNHARETENLAAEIAAGRQPQPDLVIWPENSSDIDPLRNPDAAARIDAAARAVRAPIMVGAVLVNPGRTTSNAALVWEAGTGVVDRQDKRRIQPFGEYMPWRSFFRLFSSYVDRAGYFVPGGGDGLVDLAGVPTAVAICWEIAFDDAFGDAVDAGAQLLAVPSNNATFGFSEMTYQQMAMSRVRAVEFDRPVVVATTSGVSGMITPQGAVTARTGQFVPGVLVDRIELRTTTTLSARLRSGPEWTLTVIGLLAAGAACVAVRRERGEAVGSAEPSDRRARAGKDEDG